MNWTTEDPGIGSPAEIRGYATSRGTTAASLRSDAAAQLSAALANTTGWSGTTADAVRGVLTRVQPEPSLIADQLEAEARTLSSYAAEVERIQTRVRSIQSRREDIESARWAADLEMNQYSARFDIVTGAEAADQARLERRISVLTDQLGDLRAELQALVADRENADAACVNALAGTGVLGSLASFSAGGSSSAGLLSKLAQLSATDLLILAQTQPGVFEQLRTAPPAITEVADWWANLDATAQAALIAAVPAVIGSMNGVPVGARIAANQVNAVALIAAAEKERAELKEFLQTARERTQVYGSDERVRLLEKEIAYLRQVEAGQIQLYLYDRDADRAIEVIGNPAKAKVILSYMPGTNASLEAMYDGIFDKNDVRQSGMQDLAQWEVNASNGNVLAFIVKDGSFPQVGSVDELLVEGPQHNGYADRIGARYAEFMAGLATTEVGTLPVVSVEHSFGTAAAGEAEQAHDTHFDTRILLGGIGMKDGWEPDPNTTYLGFAAPNDFNHIFNATPWGGGIAAGDFGYPVAPTRDNGIETLDSGIPVDNETAIQTAKALSPLIGTGLELNGMIENHNQIVSAEAENQAVLAEIARRLREVGGY